MTTVYTVGASRVTSRLDELRALGKELDKAKNARVRVGILGNKAARFSIDSSTATEDKLNNPTLGLIHEFGTKEVPFLSSEIEARKLLGKHKEGSVARKALPARSFLRMPLMTRLPSMVDKIGRAVWRALVLKKGIVEALKNLGALAENVVQSAFNSGGFGQWAPLAASTIRRKKSSAILIESAQLRKGVTSRVYLGGKAA